MHQQQSLRDNTQHSAIQPVVQYPTKCVTKMAPNQMSKLEVARTRGGSRICLEVPQRKLGAVLCAIGAALDGRPSQPNAIGKVRRRGRRGSRGGGKKDSAKPSCVRAEVIITNPHKVSGLATRGSDTGRSKGNVKKTNSANVSSQTPASGRPRGDVRASSFPKSATSSLGAKARSERTHKASPGNQCVKARNSALVAESRVAYEKSTAKAVMDTIGCSQHAAELIIKDQRKRDKDQLTSCVDLNSTIAAASKEQAPQQPVCPTPSGLTNPASSKDGVVEKLKCIIASSARDTTGLTNLLDSTRPNRNHYGRFGILKKPMKVYEELQKKCDAIESQLRDYQHYNAKYTTSDHYLHCNNTCWCDARRNPEYLELLSTLQEKPSTQPSVVVVRPRKPIRKR